MTNKEPGHGMPIYGPMLEEGLYDPHEAPEHSRWLPFNAEAAELASCLEACKQLVEMCRLFGSKRRTKRQYTLLATPTYSLVEHTIRLHKLLGPKDRSKWPPSDVEHFTGVARSLRKRLHGPLKKLRDQLSAHHDPTALWPGKNSAAEADEILLPAVAEALIVLILAINHDATFGYFRLPDPAKPNEVQIMIEYPMATLFELDERGQPCKILEFRLTADPRHEASATIQKAIKTYNRIARSIGPPHPEISLVRKKPSRRFSEGKIEARIL